MTLGKALRLRRIFAQGRAVLVDFEPSTGDPLGQVRLLARTGVDAILVTPGLLEVVSDELGALAVILRIGGGLGRPHQLASVQAALEMGAEGVCLSAPDGAPDRFGRVTEDARRLGMPVFAEIHSQDWLPSARLAAGCGADVIQAPFTPDLGEQRGFVRATGRPLVLSLDAPAAELLDAVYEGMQGPAQGLTLCLERLSEPETGALLGAVHALVHQGVTVEEALARQPE